MRGKRGQLEISFGMIFSIIMIIAVVAISFYVIQYFTKLSKCTTTGLFYDALQQEVNSAWEATSSNQLFSANIPSSAEYVCFGNMSENPDPADRGRYDELWRMYRLSDANVFMYPQAKGCQSLNSHHVEKLSAEPFFCVQNEDNRVEIIVKKDAFDTSVTAMAR